MSVFTVPAIGGPQGPTGPTGPASAAQEYGGISIQGFIGSGNPNQALVASFWNKLVNFTNDMPSSGVTPQFALSQVTVVTTGDYFVFAGTSWAYGPVGSMRLALFINGVVNLSVISGNKTFAFTPSMTDAQNILSLTAGDVLDIRMNPSAAAAARFDSAQLYIERANP